MQQIRRLLARPTPHPLAGRGRGASLCQLLPVTALGLVSRHVDRPLRRPPARDPHRGDADADRRAACRAHDRRRDPGVGDLRARPGQGVVGALDAPARHALVFQMVGTEDLANAVSLSSSLGTIARVLGPAIGGVVVATAGEGTAFGVNAASFLAIVHLAPARRPDEAPQAPRQRARDCRQGSSRRAPLRCAPPLAQPSRSSSSSCSQRPRSRTSTCSSRCSRTAPCTAERARSA